MGKKSKRPAMVNRFGITDEQFWSLIEPEEYPCDCRLWLGEWDRSGYGIIHWSRFGVIVPRKSIYQSVAYRIAYRWSPYCGKQPGDDITHLCGLAACCNPLHLFPMSRLLNIKDAWEHRRILHGITDEQRHELRASGMSFKEISRTLDIPGGVAFKLLYDEIERDRYPAPFIDDKALLRQPKEWYEARHNAELARGADAYAEPPKRVPVAFNEDEELFTFPMIPERFNGRWVNPFDED